MITTLIIAVVAVLLIVALLCMGYVKAPPDIAYIISGMHKKPRILIGKAGFKIPFFERLDKLALGAIQIDVKTKSAVPTAEYINVKVDSTVSVQVGRAADMIEIAAQNFLNVKRDVISAKVNDLLEGNIREIVGQMKLTEMVSDRKAFSDRVQSNVVPDLAKFGLELVSFNVQNFSDEGGVIDNLGIDNVEQIRKDAAIAKSNAQREIAVAEAANAKAANDAKVKAAEEIAVQNNALEMKRAALKKTEDTAKAQADALRAQGEAEAAAIQAKGEAEAAAIRAKAEAEAKGMLEKAEALKQYGDAAKQQMELDALKVLYEQLPAIAEAIGNGYANANIHMIGNDSGQLAGNMMGNITQIIEAFKGSTGIDPTSVISGMLGAKLSKPE